MTNKFYLTTAIDYASGNPHIGHAYEKISADILARWNRAINKKVFFLTGTDEHGQKVSSNAQKANLSPQAYANIESEKFVKLCKKLEISNDYFIKTTQKEHKLFVQKMLQKAYENKDIYKDNYTGHYCVGCEKFLGKDEVNENEECLIHKAKTIQTQEENYMFKLSKYQDKLLTFYEENPNFISPKSRTKEVINRVKEGLTDISISRPKTRLDWGIELPFDNTHVTYVWFDALFNYVSGLEINKKENFWPANLHIIGADIQWFHVVYFPAFLMSVGYQLPKKIFSHGMILDENGHKMSKSLGNIIDPFEQIEKFGLEEFKFYLMSLGTFGEDLKYNEKDFINKINNDLNNDLGNLISRVHSMTFKYFQGIVPEIDEERTIDEILKNNLHLKEELSILFDELKFSQVIDKVWTQIREVNAYINQTSPWKEQDQKRLATIISYLISSCLIIADYIEPIMPNKAKLIYKQFNYKNENKFEFNILKKGHKLNEKTNLFNKIEIKKEEPKNFEKEGIELLNLKVGEIIDCKKHPQSDKLLIEEINVGEEKPRTIVSGLQKYYSPEEMIGKKVIVICNLKTAKLAGIESQGMVLVSENEKNELGLLLSNANPGTHLNIENKIANNENRLKKIEKFFDLKIYAKNNKIYLNDKQITANKEDVYVDKEIDGLIC